MICFAVLIAVEPSFAADSASRQRLFVRYDAAPGFERASAETIRGAVRARGGRVGASFPALGAVAVEIEAGEIASLLAVPGVVAVEPDPPRRLHAIKTLRTAQLVASLENGLYGLVKARFLEAHGGGRNGAGVLVGVADSGLDCGHPDIAPALVSSVNLVGFAGGGSGCTGANGVPTGEDHATHVAGTIVAAQNKVGVLGGSFGARLVHARVCAGLGQSTCQSSDVMQGVEALANAGARIINLSLGGEQDSVVERTFFQLMRERNVLVVASAGNEARDSLSVPARYDSVLSVGAVEPSDQPALFSNFGPGLDLVAPGVAVLSSVPRSTGREATVRAANTSIFAATELAQSGAPPKNGLRKKLIPAGIGRPEEFPKTVKGQIALIQRGELLFAEKVANAMAAGAVGAIIFNNRAGPFTGTLSTTASPSGKPWIPTLGISQGAGQTLLTFRRNKPVVMQAVVTDWEHFDGTSMAAPHASAAAALVWAAHPELDASGVEQRLKAGAADLGEPGTDARFGAGRLDVAAALN